MQYDVKEPVTEPVFGLAFHHESGAHIAGPNSQEGGTVAGTVSEPGYVDYHFDRLPLSPGIFVITTGIVDSSQTHVFDYRDQAFELRVQPGHRPRRARDRPTGRTLVGHPSDGAVSRPAHRALGREHKAAATTAANETRGHTCA